MVAQGKFAADRLVPVEHGRQIKVNFNADMSESLPWGFVPQQKYVYVVPGQSALAFYSAHNRSDQDIVGIATYSVAPAKVRTLAP
jgi:cytochrome c oxidase assembly protein subunit 11